MEVKQDRLADYRMHKESYTGLFDRIAIATAEAIASKIEQQYELDERLTGIDYLFPEVMQYAAEIVNMDVYKEAIKILRRFWWYGEELARWEAEELNGIAKERREETW